MVKLRSELGTGRQLLQYQPEKPALFYSGSTVGEASPTRCSITRLLGVNGSGVCVLAARRHRQVYERTGGKGSIRW